MLLVASHNGTDGMEPAWAILAAGGSALDAVETGTRHVENDPGEHTVGFGGYPNVLGEVELEASIMDGTTRNAGAVGALKGFRHPISVSRRIMDDLPHVFLAGDGAAYYAAELGLPFEDLLTEHSQQVYTEGLCGRPPLEHLDSPTHTLRLADLARASIDPDHFTGTVNFIAQDAEGRIASAVSSSGWAWKYPGRLGDTAVIGAGNYADDRYGAATCAGWGELAIRTSIARSIVNALELGLSVHLACRRVYADIAPLISPSADPPVHVIAVDTDGNHAGYTTASGRPYLVWADGMASFDRRRCTVFDRSSVTARADAGDRSGQGHRQRSRP